VRGSSSGKVQVQPGKLVLAELDDEDLSSEVRAVDLGEAAHLVGEGATVCRVPPHTRGAARYVCRRGG